MVEQEAWSPQEPLRRALPGGAELDTDRARIDVDRVHRWLSEDAYWAIGRPRDVLERAIAGSWTFGAYAATGEQLAFARIVTDGATFAWLADVYVDPAARGAGLGTAFVAAIMDAVEPLGLRRVLLTTLDAHGVYERFGFVVHPNPEQVMVRTRA